MPKGTCRRSRSCYNSGCHNPVCEEENREYLRDYYRISKQYHSLTPDVDPTPAMRHIEALRAGGMGNGSIAKAAGLNKETIRNISVGSRTRGIRPDTERNILSVQLAAEWADSTGTMRRVQALAALGHTFASIAAEAGLRRGNTLSDIVRGQQSVRRTTAEQVAAAYERMSMTHGPSFRTRAYARAQGWAVPLAWDDETIDDPTATPVGMHKKGQRGQLDLDEWFRLVRYGEHPERAAERCGVKLGSVDWHARRHGRSEEYVTAMERSRERHAA